MRAGHPTLEPPGSLVRHMPPWEMLFGDGVALRASDARMAIASVSVFRALCGTIHSRRVRTHVLDRRSNRRGETRRVRTPPGGTTPPTDQGITLVVVRRGGHGSQPPELLRSPLLPREVQKARSVELMCRVDELPCCFTHLHILLLCDSEPVTVVVPPLLLVANPVSSGLQCGGIHCLLLGGGEG